MMNPRLFTFILLSLYSVVTLFLINGESFFVNVLFLLLMIQSLYYLFVQGSEGFSVYKVYFVFSYIFLSYIPLLHYSAEIVFWGAQAPSVDDYVITIFYLLFFNFVVGFSYNFGLLEHLRLSSSVMKKTEPKGHDYRISNILIVTFTTLVTFFSLYKEGFNPNGIFFRGIINDDAIVFSSSYSLIIARFTAFFPMFSLLIYSNFNKNKYKFKLYLFLCVLLCAFPLAISRFAVAAVYLPIILFYYRRLMEGQVMTLGLIGSICFLFPFLEQFRNYDMESEVSILPDPSFFYAAHFDAFQNLLGALSSDFITYGNQLLGGLFFYIPRILWPSKPIGSGALLAENMGYSFSNISMPLAAEAYINFGIFGGVVWALLIALGMRKVDVLYWSASYKTTYFPIIYFFFISFTTFILRGDFMSSFAYFIGGVFSFLFAKFLFECGKRSV